MPDSIVNFLLQAISVIVGIGCAWMGVAVLGNESHQTNVLTKKWSLSEYELAVLLRQTGVKKVWTMRVMLITTVCCGLLFSITGLLPEWSVEIMGASIALMLLGTICLGVELFLRPRAFLTRKIMGALEPSEIDSPASTEKIATLMRERVRNISGGYVLWVRCIGMFLVVGSVVMLVTTVVPMMRLGSLLTHYLKWSHFPI